MVEAQKILVVDDEADVEDLIKRRFRRDIKEGRFEFVFARDGVEGLETIKADESINIALCDINMPRMDGLTLVQHLSELERVISPVMVSAYGDMDRIRTAMNLGAFDFVTKPIDFDDLRTTLEKTVEAVRLLKERTIIRELFGKYLPDSVAKEILERGGTLEPQSTDAAILFVDLARFTPLAETLSPIDLVETLNEYFTALVDVIESHGGIVTQFQGDAILAVFNVPLPMDDYADAAVRAGIEIQRVMRVSQFKGRQLTCRVGVDVGEVIAGNVGAEQRLNYTVHGEAVNRAARLEQLNKDYGTSMLVSEATKLLAPEIAYQKIGETTLRGVTGPVAVFSPEDAPLNA